VPEWPSAVFWPLISDLSGNFQKFVVDAFYFPLVPGLLVSGKRGACLFKDGIPTSSLVTPPLRLELGEGSGETCVYFVTLVWNVRLPIRLQ
jgi:hypothetical protein